MYYSFALDILLNNPESSRKMVQVKESFTHSDHVNGMIVSVARLDESDPKFKFTENAIDIAISDKLEIGSMSDGYHTFDELYDFRKAYNACLFNEWYHIGKYNVHKSYKHNDGELCFGGGWFVVVATTEFGQITNHYENKDWQLFNVEEVEKAKDPWDGHTPKDALERLMNTACKSLIIGG